MAEFSMITIRFGNTGSNTGAQQSSFISASLGNDGDKLFRRASSSDNGNGSGNNSLDKAFKNSLLASLLAAIMGVDPEDVMKMLEGDSKDDDKEETGFIAALFNMDDFPFASSSYIS